ncbi:ATP-dependent zinc protease [soil metagenome]
MTADVAQRDSGALQTVGWREWVGLPALGVDRLKAKIDTGARTSALHTFEIRVFEEDERQRVRFGLHPRQYHEQPVHFCTADVLDRREVTDSGGHTEERIVIRTPVALGGLTWPIEITLTARDSMRFRMLLGRTAIRRRLRVDPAQSFLMGRRR